MCLTGNKLFQEGLFDKANTKYEEVSLQHAATRCITLHHAATCCNTLQNVVTCCNTLQYAVPHCNTQHII